MLVVVWAAVLVPIWLQRHDSVTESRSVDRFSTAMRVLSRRTSSPAGMQYVVMPRRQPGAQAPHVSSSQRSSRRPTPRDARASLRARRQRVLLALLGAAALTLLLALAGVLSWWLSLLVDLLLAGYLVHLRKEAVRAARLARPMRRTVIAGTRPAPDAGRGDVPVTASAGAPLGVPAPAEAPAAVPAESGWSPVPVPLPTYVTAPVARAPRPPRERLLPPPAAEPFEPDDAEVEVLFARRWAVND